MKYISIFILFITNLQAPAQKKHWIDKYWLASSVQVLYGQNTGTGVHVDIGKTIGQHFNIGMGYGYMEFNEIQKANLFSLYAEAFVKQRNTQLYAFIKPGMALAHKAKDQLATLSRWEFSKSNMGSNLQLGTGVRFMVKRHAFFIQAGYSTTNYSMHAKEYTTPVDPYNPFYEDPINHTYKLQFQKIVLSLGIRL
jgi:hypothetical protein